MCSHLARALPGSRTGPPVRIAFLTPPPGYRGTSHIRNSLAHKKQGYLTHKKQRRGARNLARALPGSRTGPPVRIHFIIVMIRRTGLAPWEFGEGRVT